MTSLSFDEGRPIGIIKGGEHKNQILYIQSGDKKKEKARKKIKIKDIPYDKMMMLDDLFFNGVKGRMKLLELEKLKRAIAIQQEPLDPKLNKMYHDANEILQGKLNKELVLHSGEIIPVPKVDGRECLYICGPSGSGKSTYISQYVERWKKIYPKKDIVLFSRVSEDEPIDKLKPLRIKIDENLIDMPIEPEELADSLVIFDDTDTIPEKNLRDAMISLKDDLLEIGRHHNIYVVISSHLINNYKESRKILNECHQMTVFPSSGSAYPIKYCLKNNFGMDKKQIQRLMKLPSRWVTIFKHFPQTVMYSKGAYLLSNN